MGSEDNMPGRRKAMRWTILERKRRRKKKDQEKENEVRREAALKID